MTEKRFSLIACQIVGGLLVLESLAMLFVALFTLIIGGLAGALAFGVGAGSATNEKLLQGFAMIVITLATPFVVAAVLAIGGILLLLRRRKGIVVAVGVFALSVQIVFQLRFAEGFSAAALVPCIVQVLAIAAAFAFVPAPAPPVAIS